VTNVFRKIKKKITRHFDKDFQSYRDLTKRYAQIVRKQRVLQSKLSCTHERTKRGGRPWDMFDKLLFNEYEQNKHTLQQLAKERVYNDIKISRHKCIGKPPFSLLTNRIIQFLNQRVRVKKLYKYRCHH